jgi:hypothetical protein
MIYPTRVVPLAALLLISIAVERPSGGTAQGLALTAEVGKTVFFEDEPIFVLLRLTNVGSDTAWVMDDFAAISQSVQMSLSREGEAVPVGGLWIDYVCPLSGGRCGKPLAPGESRLTAGILQDRAGDQTDLKRSLLRGHLGPGEYELRVSTHGADAAPIAFQVRERSPTETRDVKELEAIRSMMRDQPPTPFESAQISWVARHPPDDPFFPVVLAQWLYFPGTMEGVDLDSLRSVVLHADRSSPAGAYVAQSMEGWRPDQLGALVGPLGTSLAGEMARYLVERRQRKQR